MSEARARLLAEIRAALLAEPAALTVQVELPEEHIRDLRSRLSSLLGSAAMRLNEAGFKQIERIYRMRDDLAAGRPVAQDDLSWLEIEIAREESSAR